jgi:DNA-damage-inducible protein D
MYNITNYNESVFESIKHIDENGCEYWYARELGKVLDYSEYRKFLPIIKKAITSCINSNESVSNHFGEVAVMVAIGSNAKRKLKDYKLSRYACYLIVQNSDSSKPVVALGQTYFAIQTRKQELSEKEYNELSEDEKRLYRRNQARKGNYNLNKTAVNSGVKDLARFHKARYKGLYNEYTANSVHYEVGMEVRNSIKRLGGTMLEELQLEDMNWSDIINSR